MSSHRPLVLGVLLLLAGSAASATPEQVHYALIVASNTGTEPSQAPLRYADDDGARYYELFAPRSREVVLLSVLDAETQALHPGLAAKTRPPTHPALGAALARLNARMAEDRAKGSMPVLTFVFVGHGKRGAAGEGAVSLLDGPLTRTELYERVVAPSKASFLQLIVDACDSYFFVHSRGALPVGPAYVDAVKGILGNRELARFPQVGVVLSTASEQESQEWSAIRSGVFSHMVRSALSGAGDVNGDGKVDYAELRAFVAAASQGTDDVRGQPNVFIQPPALNRAFALTDLGDAASLGYLMVPTGLAGRLWVEDSRGIRVVELHKERERPLVVALPLGRGYYLRGSGREAPFAISRASEVVDAGGLPWHDASVAARGAVQDVMRDKLFSVPFGPRFYRGYMASLGITPSSDEADAVLVP
ncbi:hypothetical protein HJC22_28350 [Corallococcus exiguus]|uniref:hypothetical protein n=1 Tax=Corallococcus TaxID=83461 RepID=UPI000EBE6657|nr:MULTISPECIES: hypothetical protein [Corallococcus]NNC19635.1 hypothetical protein [Corallococcus exiguus]RKI00677.1 hypothetical protein D7Y15_37715 [Corallococcus sp. AB030]RUO88801.1 hypothetical protein D7Y11_33600 [Corallococcus sp. AB018]